MPRGDKSKKLALIVSEGKRLAAEGKTPSEHLRQITPKQSRQRITARQIAFADDVTSGMTLTQAYKNNYDTSKSKNETVWSNACSLASNKKVQARIQENYARMDDNRSNIEARRREYVLVGLQKEAEQAETDGARIRALELLGKTIAMFTDGIQTDDVTDKTATELEQEIKSKLARFLNAQAVGE